MRFLKSLLILSLIASGIFLQSCDESDPVSDQMDHFEAVGLRIYSSGALVLEYYKGTVNDTLFAPVGGIGDHMEVKFLKDGKAEVDPPSDSDKSFAFEIENTSMLEIYQHPGEEGGYEFHLKGLQQGDTRMKFKILHNGHPDFTTDWIPVHIETQAGSHGEPVGLRIKDEATSNPLITVDSTGNVFGTIVVAAGDSTDHLVAFFFDSNGVEFQPDVAMHTLYYAITDTTIAGIEPPSQAEPWAFKIIGKTAGASGLNLGIYHDTTLAKTFTTVPITVN